MPETLRIAYTIEPDGDELDFSAVAIEGGPSFKFVAGMSRAKTVEVRREAFLGFGIGRRLNEGMTRMMLNDEGRLIVLLDQELFEKELARGWRGRLARTMNCNVMDALIR